MSGPFEGDLRAGLRLLRKTVRQHHRDLTISILGALLWMAAVVSVPRITGVAVDRAIAGARRDLIAPMALAVVLVGAALGLGIAIRRYFGFRVAYHAEASLRNQMFERIQRLTFGFHDSTSTGQLMARGSSDLSQVRIIYSMLPITIANTLMFFVVISVLVLVDQLLGVIVFLTVPALLLSARAYARRVIRASFSLQQRLADLSQVVEETFGGIQVVKSYGQEGQEHAKLDHRAGRIYGTAIGLARTRSIFAPLFELIPMAATVAVLWFGGLRVIDGRLTIGEFVAFTQYLAILALPLRITGWFFAQLPRAAAAASRIESLLGTEADIADPVDPVDLRSGPGEVRFSGVSFAYPDQPEVLSGVDLVIPGGTSVALVGSTGAGKTTLAHLVPRFRDVTAGAVAIDGVDVRRLQLDELRREVAVVFQETFLFSASVRDNIAFGAPNATDHQVRLAARLAQAHEFIVALPDGYETVVGERGHSLSGGQRQRVALARAVLRDPRVLILDDATSSVDAIVEADMLTALAEVMRGRTTIIIAHRTSTLAVVDRVVFVEGGGIAAVGTHRELMMGVPRYAEVLAQEEAKK